MNQQEAHKRILHHQQLTQEDWEPEDRRNKRLEDKERAVAKGPA